MIGVPTFAEDFPFQARPITYDRPLWQTRRPINRKFLSLTMSANMQR